MLGAAVSGLAAARLAHSRGHDVLLYDRRREALHGVGADTVVLAGEWQPAELRDIDLVVTSPGFPEHEGPIPDVLAAGIPLLSEMQFAATDLKANYAAVTGTNGKTTVTAAAADMLAASGIDAVAAGNIGKALSDVAHDPPAVVVIEASSFQLRFIDSFHPVAAAILNIAPDHLDWHQDLGEYVAAKQRIFENQTGDDILVYDADDEGATAAVATAATRRIPVSGERVPPGGYGVTEEELVFEGGTIPRPDLDRAYTMDLVAAATIAAHLGASTDGIAATIASFVPGRHRRSTVGVWDEVAWVNDSKATNPHAALASVAAFDSVVLIAGGRNKGLDLAPLANAATLRRVIGIGEAATELESSSPPGRFEAARDLGDAIASADRIAQPGDTVLLAPGCASFDMFDSYEQRGEEFTRLVLELKGEDDGQ